MVQAPFLKKLEEASGGKQKANALKKKLNALLKKKQALDKDRALFESKGGEEYLAKLGRSLPELKLLLVSPAVLRCLLRAPRS